MQRHQPVNFSAIDQQWGGACTVGEVQRTASALSRPVTCPGLESIISSWLHGCEDIGEGEALIAEARRALATLPPDMADPAFLADTRLILKKQAKALSFMRTLNFLQKRKPPF